LEELGQWPLLECLISQEWQETVQLCQVAVARQSPATGEVVVGGFLVDLGCLGVKNALTNLYTSAAEYRREYRQHLMASQPMMDCDLDLAAKVIEEGTNYARSLGFNPHSDTAMALKILGDAHPEKRAETIPLGKDGKPLFVNGPHDDVARITRILDRNVGQGNYEVIIFLGIQRNGHLKMISSSGTHASSIEVQLRPSVTSVSSQAYRLAVRHQR
jgi:hypothetical protein